jgi:galactokinase
MFQSHDSLRDDYEVSCRELDVLVGLARGLGTAGGVIGSRMTGGGFGGCTVSLIRAEQAPQVIRALREGYVRETGIDPTIFVSRPGPGACVVKSA